MPRLKASIAYDGTNFYGWQIQPHHPTIQSTIETCLQQICGKRVHVYGAGRTDSGVHAYGQVAHFDWEHPLEPGKLLLGMNGLLPDEIRVLSLTETDPDFHARFDALSKIYLYRIDRNRIESPFSSLYSLHYSYPLNLELMKRCVTQLSGEHDFAAFQATGSDVTTSVRKILEAQIIESPVPPVWPLPSAEGPHFNYLYIRIEANGFLRKMVRFLVGTMLEIGTGKRDPEDLRLALDTQDRSRVGIPVPARGLFLEKVRY